MKEIKFRAKRTDNGLWVYGYYREFDGMKNEVHFISYSIIDRDGEVYEIDLETLGQFIGLNDKNGKEIYEKDIVILGNYPFTNDKKEVEWDNDLCGFRPFAELLCPMTEDDDVGEVRPMTSFCEVIGNISENPNVK